MSGVVKSPLQDLFSGDPGLNPENQSDNWGCFQKADFYLFIFAKPCSFQTPHQVLLVLFRCKWTMHVDHAMRESVKQFPIQLIVHVAIALLSCAGYPTDKSIEFAVHQIHKECFYYVSSVLFFLHSFLTLPSHVFIWLPCFLPSSISHCWAISATY